MNVVSGSELLAHRDTGRCIGSVTWTDKLIQSMNSGFFRVLDASRYMELDRITGKHCIDSWRSPLNGLDMILVDARKLAD